MDAEVEVDQQIQSLVGGMVLCRKVAIIHRDMRSSYRPRDFATL